MNHKKEMLMLSMEDGVKLQTVIHLPQALEASVPVILKRSCYPGQEEELEQQAEEFCSRGFGFVYQWCRGTGMSEGEWEPNVNERADGICTVNWLADQPYVKSIGYWGDSYLALTGWCMIDAVQDKVKTMVLGVYGVDRHTSAYKDGMFRQDVLTSWAMQNAGKQVAADMEASYRYRPQIEVDEKMWEIRLDWYRDWISHPDRTDDYWNRGFWGMLKHIPEKVRIPVFIKDGWYDHHLGSALVTYDLLSEEAKKHSVLQIGPWNHAYENVIPQECALYAARSNTADAIDWFEKVLMREQLPTGYIEEYVIGADKWIKKKERKADAQNTCMYLDLEKETGRKLLLTECADEEAEVVYTYDPENPVRSHGSEALLANMQENGSFEQPEADWREDVASFISEPLKEGFVTDGEMNACLYVSSDAGDTAFTAKVMEVFPDGTARNVRGGITTLAYRNDSDIRKSYEPGEVVEINISMWDIAWRFRAGSRIRVDISSSDFPQYSIHTNYPGVWALQERTRKAQQKIYIGKDYPSRIEFPIKETE